MTFKTHGLDIGYITNTLAVCSGPTDKTTSKGVRNNIYKLVDVLNQNHGRENWKIINLRKERIGYDPGIIERSGGHFELFEVADHQPIPFRLVLKIVKDIDLFILSHDKGVVVIHCKYGKGRSGQLACSYLMFKHGLNRLEANQLFKSRRKLYKSGVTIKSQLRYLEYFELFLLSDPSKRLYKYLSTKDCSTTIAKFVIHKPSLELMRLNRLLDKDIFNVMIKVHEPQDGWCSTFNTITNSEDPDFVEIKCSGRLGDNNKIDDVGFTICSSFNAVNGKFWINIPMEIAKDMIHQKISIRELEALKATSNGKEKEFVITRIIDWNEFDGYHGTMKKGLKLFENIEVEMSITYMHTEQLQDILSEYNYQ